MKQPKLKNLKLNQTETKAIRSKAAKAESIKITINIDSDSLSQIKELAADSGVPYQRLINRFLKESLQTKDTTSKRLDKLEREVRRLKKTLAA